MRITKSILLNLLFSTLIIGSIAADECKTVSGCNRTQLQGLWNYPGSAFSFLLYKAGNKASEAMGEIFVPEFPGGHPALIEYLRKNVIYPDQERKKGIEGKVNVRFIVTKDGSLDSIKVIKSEPYVESFNREALRVINQMPRWFPGEASGKKVNMEMIIPFNFYLNNNRQIIAPRFNAGFSYEGTKKDKNEKMEK